MTQKLIDAMFSEWVHAVKTAGSKAKLPKKKGSKASFWWDKSCQDIAQARIDAFHQYWEHPTPMGWLSPTTSKAGKAYDSVKETRGMAKVQPRD